MAKDQVKAVFPEGNVPAPPEKNVWNIKSAKLGIGFAKIAFGAFAATIGVVTGLVSVYEIFYAASITIEAPASDPKFAFEYPFRLINNSHLFTITDLRWTCKIIVLEAPPLLEMKNDVYNVGSISTVAAGGFGWLDCAVLGPNSRVVRLDRKPEIKLAKLEVSVSYRANFHFLSWPISPKPTFFTWSADASNPQWIVGESL